LRFWEARTSRAGVRRWRENSWVVAAVAMKILYDSFSPTSVAAKPPNRGAQSEATVEMAELLESRVQRLRRGAAGRSRYFSFNAPWQIPAYRLQIERAASPGSRLELRLRLAQELLWDGRSLEAHDELKAISRALVERSQRGEPPLRSVPPRKIQQLIALSGLRIGEQANCLSQHTPESCLFPIQGSGVHADKTGSLSAIEVLSAQLRDQPYRLDTRWLLNIAYMTIARYPDGVPARWRISPESFESDYDIGRFPNLASARGAALEGLAGGISMEDFDGDGRLDLIASSWGVRDQLVFLRNEGAGKFSNRTEQAGLAGETGGLNITHGDYDNDGNPDLLILRGGWLDALAIFPNSLLRNRGDGSFEDVTKAAGLYSEEPGQTAAWGDYDGDGWLDLFVGNETQEPGASHPCQLYHNQKDGTFREVATETGLAELGFVKGVAWGDYDNDGRPDLYVSRMGQANLLFHNDGAGTPSDAPWKFSEVAAKAGVAEPKFSFPTWFFDYDNDGWLDLFVAAWDGSTVGQVAGHTLGMPVDVEHPRLFRNQRDGTFSDLTEQSGLDRVLLAMGANFGDLDNDGFLDLYVGTGAPDLATVMPNRMFRNAAGASFQDVTTSGGFGHLQKGHGIAFGDLDSDGDQDIVAIMGGWYSGDAAPNALFVNPGHANHWVTLRLRGDRANRLAVGARIHLIVQDANGRRDIHRQVGTGGSFGASSLQQEVGLGGATSIVSIDVRWPGSGTTQRFVDLALDRIYELREGDPEPHPITAPGGSTATR
jgi:hypothetical protein